MKSPSAILAAYRRLLGEVDAWFDGCLQAAGPQLACRRGCSDCCRGLFEISLLDAWLLLEAFERLPEATRAAVRKRSAARLAELQRRWPQLRNPYLLNGLPEAEWTAMPEDDPTPCPLLDAAGLCLVYDARPLICRLHGLPNLDLSGEDFDGTVCTLHPADPLQLPSDLLRWRFRATFAAEVRLLREFSACLTGTETAELDTFIPLALLADYGDVDWARQLS